MQYVELLRARRALTWYCGIVLALVALGLALAFKDGPPQIQMSHEANPVIPLWWVLTGCAFGPIFLAAFMAVGLDAEYKTAAITWTRPMSRLAIAARYVVVDLATLLAAWLFNVALCTIVLFALGLWPYVTATSQSGGAWDAPLAFGCAVMWYGLVVLCTVLVPGRGTAIAGASWAYVLFVPALAAIPFPPLLHSVMAALNWLNPLAYLSTRSNRHDGMGAHIDLGSGAPIAGSTTVHLMVVWLIGLVAVAIAARLWTVREVPA